MEKQQREFLLRKQMDSIRKELGEDDASVVDEYRTKIDEAAMPEAVREQADKELARFERMGESSPESQMIRSYLDWLLAVPWGVRSDEVLDPEHTREVLDADHAGLEDVKDRIVEYIAVAKLRKERGIEPDKRAGAILTLIGPPGTGKTSIGESIAKALNREFVRMSLGGVRDEAEIRGHRRTYIGALPGRLVRALRDAKTMNPVILLDEVDKVGADWRGDPSAALLEVLDPAQNSTFRDHYLDVEVDLSQVFFIATANMAETIPGPLLDRMEVIRFDGYTTDEKVAIARGYLWPRQRERAGLEESEVSVSDDVLETVISEYTREAGVRQLERELGSILRKTATKIVTHEATPPVAVDVDAVRDALGRQKFFREAAERTAVPGVATGLAVNVTGGDVLFVEATAVPGEGLVLTGQLGDVMKESAQIALSAVRSQADRLGIDQEAFERKFHVHVPAGAIPKDGPSAGITMATALASLLSGRPVKHTVGMTGELTLQGRVLPIGGLKQKVLAAHAAGLTDVVIPERNRADLDDVPEHVREELTFHPVMSLDEVLDVALEPATRNRTSRHDPLPEVQSRARGGPPCGGPPRGALDGLDPVGLVRGREPLQRAQAGRGRDPAAHPRAAPRRARVRRAARAARDRREATARRVPPDRRGPPPPGGARRTRRLRSRRRRLRAAVPKAGLWPKPEPSESQPGLLLQPEPGRVVPWPVSAVARDRPSERVSATLQHGRPVRGQHALDREIEQRCEVASQLREAAA